MRAPHPCAERAAARVQLYNLGTQGVGSGHGLFQPSSQLAERWHSLIDFSLGIGVYGGRGERAEALCHPNALKKTQCFVYRELLQG